MTDKIKNIEPLIISDYIEKKLTTKQISKKYTINVKTVIKVLKINNVILRKTQKNLLGNVYGRLTVTKYSRLDNSQKAMWMCLCQCGNITEVRSGDLISNKIKSCGCLLSETSRENVKISHKKYPKSYNYKGIGDLTGSYIRRIKHHALLKRREYNLTKEYMWELFLKQNKKCALTGLDIWFGVSTKEKNNGKKEQTASLDRIDSSKGYIEGNVQWVHKDINNIKQDYSIGELVKYCKLIVNNYEKFVV